MQIERIFSTEDFIRRLEAGKEQCTEHFHWKMIQLEDDDEDGRQNLQHIYENHVTKVDTEK